MDSPAPETERDEAIVERTLQDQEWFGELILRYEAKLSRYIMRLGIRNPDDRDDVLQEIFIKVYKNLQGFDTSLPFSSWIYRIAHNEAISWYRKAKVRPEGHLVDDTDGIFAVLSSDLLPAEVQFDEGVNAGEVGTALQKLDEKYRIVLILRFYEHKEYEDISDILKIPTGTVGTLVHRGKKELAKILDQEKLRI